MLFNENNLKNIVEGFNTPVSVAREYFNDNMESILEDYSYVGGYLAVREELDKQVKEYEHFNYKKATCVEALEAIKSGLTLSDTFYDLKHLYKSIQQFKGREIYFTLFNAFNDEMVTFAEKLVSLYGGTLKDCMMYRGDFNSFYYTYFIEEEEIGEEDLICFMLDQVEEMLKA